MLLRKRGEREREMKVSDVPVFRLDFQKEKKNRTKHQHIKSLSRTLEFARALHTVMHTADPR